MAYKEETDQQFMESIIRQTAGAMRRPMGDQQFHGSRGYGADDDSFGLDNSEDYERAEPEQVDATRGRMSSFTKPYQSGPQIGSEFNEPSPDALSSKFGGYSSDSGSRHMEPAKPVDAGMEPHMEMRKLKKEIEAQEKGLHELQRRKVELMRKITGRL